MSNQLKKITILKPTVLLVVHIYHPTRDQLRDRKEKTILNSIVGDPINYGFGAVWGGQPAP